MKSWLAVCLAAASVTGCATAPVVRAGQELKAPVTEAPQIVKLAGEGEAACYEWVDGTNGALTVVARDDDGRTVPATKPVACPGPDPGGSPRWVVLTYPPASLAVEYAATAPPGAETAIIFRSSRAAVQLAASGEWIGTEKSRLHAFAPVQTEDAMVMLTDEHERRVLEMRATKAQPLFVQLGPGRYRLTSDRSEGLRMFVVQR